MQKQFYFRRSWTADLCNVIVHRLGHNKLTYNVVVTIILVTVWLN